MSETKKWVCTECSYVFEGPEPPDFCSVCQAPREAFTELVKS